MDELTVQAKAREFMQGLDLSRIRDDLSVYVDKVKARVRTEEMEDGESGYTLTKRDGSSTITVNELERIERRRFSICHEIGHLVLGLSSNHEAIPPWSYAKRDENEVWCDMFAAELLMPYEDFKASVDGEEPSFELVERLRDQYRTSFPATASRVAAVSDYPCAFVTMDAKVLRYAARSVPLKRLNAWIAPRTPIPPGSLVHGVVAEGEREGGPGTVDQDVWFVDWPKGYDLTEIARHYPEYDQAFSLLWFEEDDGPSEPVKTYTKAAPSHDEDLLRELDGNLPWRGKSKRR